MCSVYGVGYFTATLQRLQELEVNTDKNFYDPSLLSSTEAWLQGLIDDFSSRMSVSDAERTETARLLKQELQSLERSAHDRRLVQSVRSVMAHMHEAIDLSTQERLPLRASIVTTYLQREDAVDANCTDDNLLTCPFLSDYLTAASLMRDEFDFQLRQAHADELRERIDALFR